MLESVAVTLAACGTSPTSEDGAWQVAVRTVTQSEWSW